MHARLLRLGTAQEHYLEGHTILLVDFLSLLQPPSDGSKASHSERICLLKQFYNRWKYGVLGKGAFFILYNSGVWGCSSSFHIFQMRKHLHISGFTHSESLLTWVTLCGIPRSWLCVMEIQLGRGGPRSQVVKGTAEPSAPRASVPSLSLSLLHWSLFSTWQGNGQLRTSVT